MANISTRGFVQDGENVLIGGFISAGGATDRVVVRAMGSSLSDLGIANALQDPMLELRNDRRSAALKRRLEERAAK